MYIIVCYIVGTISQAFNDVIKKNNNINNKKNIITNYYYICPRWQDAFFFSE